MVRRVDLHIGDYASDTAHLSLIEHGAYLRLMCLYYSGDGQSLPVDHARIYRLACARTRSEREAVDTVLTEYFWLDDDARVYRHTRCDREIAAAQQRMSDSERREANERSRQARHREERAALFAALAAVGIKPKWNVSISALRQAAAERGIKANVSCEDLQRTCNAPATANHSPSTIHHPPHTIVTGEGGADRSAAGVSCVSGDGQGVGVNAPAPRPAQAVGLDGQGQPTTRDAARALQQAGISDARASSRELQDALASGVTVVELVDAAPVAKAKGKGLAYVLGIVNNRRTQAAQQPTDQAVPRAVPMRPADAPSTGVPGASETLRYLAEQAEHRRRAAGQAGPVDVRAVLAAKKTAGLVVTAGARTIAAAAEG